MVENTVSRRLLEGNIWEGDWKSWFKLSTVVSSAAIEVLGLQSSLLSHRLKASSRRSWDPHVIAASRISPKNLTHHQRRVAWAGTTGGLNVHHLHTPPCTILPLYFPTQLTLPSILPVADRSLGQQQAAKTGSLSAHLLPGLQPLIKRLSLVRRVSMQKPCGILGLLQSTTKSPSVFLLQGEREG